MSTRFAYFLLLTLILFFTACERSSLIPEQTPETEESAPSGDKPFTVIALDDTYLVTRATLSAVTKAEGLLLNDSLPENADYSLSMTEAPKFGVLTLLQDGAFSYQHDASEASEDSFRYELKANGLTATAVVSLNIVNPSVTTPTAQADAYNLDEGSSLSANAAQGLLKNDADPLKKALSVTLMIQPEHGSLNLAKDGSFNYTHDHSETLTDSFVYAVSNGSESAQAKVNLTIKPINDAPVIAKLELAQTHVLPPEGKTWSQEKLQNRNFHLVGNRDALVMVDIASANDRVVDAVIEAYVNDIKLAEVPLNMPASLAATEADGRAYSSTAYWANLDKSLIKVGLELKVRANEGQFSEAKPVNVGAATSFTMYTLPFYLFGLDESDILLSQTVEPDQITKDEYYAKHPIADLQMINHPAEKIEWPYIIIGPRQGRPAQKVTYKEQQGDGYAVMSATLGVLHAIRNANGDSATNNQYYAPLLMANQAGNYSGPGGGLGGGNVGTGDYSYTGVFIHEAGHAFGMPHANDGYTSGTYPYVNGSLKGSSWGYDQMRNQFLSTLIPTTASHYSSCKGRNRQLDGEGNCIKQDPMQGGAGDQIRGDKYTMFSDFNASVVQRYLEGYTTLNEDASHKYNGGKIFVDETSATGYSRWDSLDKAFVAVERKTSSGGLYGLDSGLPELRNVPVQTIIITAAVSAVDADNKLSFDPDLTQIYEPISYTGNLMRTIDPTNAEQLASIVPNTGENYWYCRNSGCDYTLKVSFSDASEQYIALHGGFRAWFSSSLKTNVGNPTSGHSFRTWSVNVTGNKSISKIELLDTAEVSKGLPETPSVITQRTSN